MALNECKKKILFRVDAGDEIGLGHFYRSINLAEELARNGHNIIFSFKPTKFWLEIIEAKFSFETKILSDESKYKSELEIIKDNDIDLLYVDGFINYEEKFIREIKKHGVGVIFYQNLTEAKKFADVYILPSIHQDKTFFLDFDSQTIIYFGLKYFTFSKDILKLDRKIPPKKLDSVGIIAGGSDPRNTLMRLNKLINQSDVLRNIKFTFYYGVNYLYKSEIRQYHDGNCKWEEFNYELILFEDLLISAHGVSTYEFLALGMPIISYGHQKQNAFSSNYLAKKTKSMVSLGIIDDVSKSDIEKTIHSFIDNPKRLEELSLTAIKNIDLKGLSRVVEIIENYNSDGK
jgi:spore coat polysaccharide biosynthesis predicted glycosyltransferase SpsG